MRRAVWVVAVAACAVLLSPSPAAAHAGSGGSEASNYLTELLEVDPPISGVRVRVLELGERLELTNDRDEDVIVLGYEGEPYLRIGPSGVFANERSAATYVNADREGGADLPDDVDPDADPEWRKVSDGRTARWHDHRAHWMATDPPPAVQADESASHVVFERWEVPLRIGNREVAVAGRLTWSPGPAAVAWLAPAALAAGLVVIGCRVARGRRARVLAFAALAIALVDIIHTAGLALAPGQVGSAGVRFAAAAVYPAMGWVCAILGARWLWRRRADGVYLVAMTGAVVFLVGGLSDVGALTRANVLFAWDAGLARVAVATSLAGGVAVLAMCWMLRPRRTMTTGELT